MRSAASGKTAGLPGTALPVPREKVAAFYRKKAIDCLRFAEECNDAETREQWMTLADGWARLAMQQSG